jgi:hypothetical protein
MIVIARRRTKDARVGHAIPSNQRADGIPVLVEGK